MSTQGYTRRMSDKYEIPEMNGSIEKLTRLIGTPLSTKTQQAEAIREIAMIQLHTYMTMTRISQSLEALLKERQNILTRLIDRFVIPLAYMVVLALIVFAFRELIPQP